MTKSLIKTAFFTSLYSYGIFFLADCVRPGFVSDVFSVHLFLIPTIIFGVWLAAVDDGGRPPSCFLNVASRVFEAVCGVLLFVLFWREGSVFGDFRLALAFAMLVLPFAAGALARHGRVGQDNNG